MKSLCCMTLCLWSCVSCTVYIVDGTNGRDKNTGLTRSNAFKTIGKCVSKLEDPGDECKIAEGRYHEVIDINGLRGTKDKPIRIKGLGDDRPIWDGTVLIRPSKWNFDPNTGICSAKIEDPTKQDLTALFLNDDLLTPARWPNAKWSDKSCFDNKNWGQSSENSKRGKMVDDGTAGLASSGINGNGSMAILNVGSFNTFVAEVKHHEAGKNWFRYRDNFGNIHWKPKKNQYYLEASLELLDAPEEWFYDINTEILYVIPPEGSRCWHLRRDKLRGRTVDYGLTIRNTTGLTIANMTFFASNIDASSVDKATHIDDITLRNVDMKFGASSHRMLKRTEKPKWTKLVAKAQNHQGPGLVHGKVSVINCTFTGSEGSALQYGGQDVLIHNNYFAWNDWTGHLMETAAGGLATTFGVGDTDGEEYSQNTFLNNGASVGIRPGTNANVSYNHVAGQCYGLIQNDGSAIQFQTKAQNGADANHNWVRDSPKYGIRFDSSPNKLGYNGKQAFNVAWNTNGLMVKGDNHTALNNLALDKFPGKSDDGQGDGCNLCVIYKLRIWPQINNNHSVVLNNAADMADGGIDKGNGQPPYGHFPLGGDVVDNNYDGLDVKQNIYDADNWDFRPLENSDFTAGVVKGPYPAGDQSFYWIPGRRLYKTSTPVPPSGSTVGSDRDVLMFLSAYRADLYQWFLGTNETNVENAEVGDTEYQGEIEAGSNVLELPQLLNSQHYYWRVDAQWGEYTYKGDIWNIYTNETLNH